MAGLRRAVAAVARHPNSVLITGETGSGKELVARAIHRRSGRGGPFVALNCGGMSEGVLESELFGHARGAFTGAGATREGLLRAAHKGTLFLDELGEMPPALQVKLLRVLETRKVRAVGAEQETSVDVRVVAATHRDVVAEVLKGSMRSDLYARLAQWTIQVPPLRERRDDIPLLARHLLARCGAAGRPVEPSLAEELLLHGWPLNVRGLLNVLSIAAIAAGEGAPLALRPEVERALDAERRIAAVTLVPPEPAAPTAPTTPVPQADTGRPPLGAAEEIEAALRRSNGNVADAARSLGWSRQQVYRWLETKGLDASRFRRG